MLSASHPSPAFDAAVYYEVNENLKLQLNVENLLDETYFPGGA